MQSRAEAFDAKGYQGILYLGVGLPLLSWMGIIAFGSI
jgi:hypothetical protein